MISLRFLLGLIPKTSEIEETETSLMKEFEELKQYTDSAELKRYEELKAFVNAANFKTRKKAIESQNFSSTKEFKEWQRLTTLQKSPKVKNYYSVINSHEYAEYEEIKKSKEFAKPSSLSEEILASPRYLVYTKYANSPALKMFEEFAGSDLKDLKTLEAFVESEEFKKVKEYMELPAKEKWAISEESKKFEEYTQLNNSEKIKWFYKVKHSKKFDKLKAWNVVFEDNFDAKIDPKKWISRYFWGDAVLKESYSLTQDLHFVADGKNIDTADSILKITTKKEKVTGKSWDPIRGFFPREFEYSSDLINTGKSYRQQYGKIEAKIRIGAGQAASHAFCLMSNSIVPQIDIMKYQNGKVMMNYFWGADNKQRSIKKFSSSKYENEFIIYEVEWTKDKIVWRINGLEVRSQSAMLPNEPMYLFLGSALYEEPGTAIMPSTLEVDWVRCYQKA